VRNPADVWIHQPAALLVVDLLALHHTTLQLYFTLPGNASTLATS
jgi:hypothetical protein